jgi:hypothetical protein
MSLERALRDLSQNDEVASAAIVQTADPETAADIIGRYIFLRSFADSLIEEAFDRVQLTPDRARQLGMCVAASAIESSARQQGSYGLRAFADDPYGRNNEPGDVGPREETPWADAIHSLGSDARLRMAQVMMNELAAQVDEFGPVEVAQRTQYYLRRLGPAEGTDFGIYNNPWETGITDSEDEVGSIADITERSSFARAVLALSADVDLTGQSASTAEELYMQGVEHTLAFVALGTARLAGQ